MGLKREDIDKLAKSVLKHLKDRGLFSGPVQDLEVESQIANVLFQNLDEEKKVEEAVSKIMEQYRAQIASGSIDSQKAYMMIKKQVAKERKFIL